MAQKFRNLIIPEELKEIPKENLIKSRKQIARQKSDIREKIKEDACLYCGKTVSSFCNSHSVPAFCLRSIKGAYGDGRIFNPNHILKIPVVDEDAGIKNTGTFQIICNDCDNKIFQDYEDEKCFETSPSGQILNAIALKNYLARIASTRLTKADFEFLAQMGIQSNYLSDSEAYKKFEERLPSIMYCASKATANERDLEDYMVGFKVAKRAKERGWNDEYHLFYFEKLPYTVPVAFQLCFPVILDLEGNVINNVYNYSPKVKEKDLHLCIFPMQESSCILAFTHRKDSSSYRLFFRQLKGLSLDDQLSLLLYLVLLYSEKVFFSKLLPKSVFENKDFIKAVQQNSDILADSLPRTPKEFHKFLESGYSLKSYKKIPPLLSEQYSMQNLSENHA